jgi:hypothetical protein
VYFDGAGGGNSCIFILSSSLSNGNRSSTIKISIYTLFNLHNINISLSVTLFWADFRSLAIAVFWFHPWASVVLLSLTTNGMKLIRFFGQKTMKRNEKKIAKSDQWKTKITKLKDNECVLESLVVLCCGFIRFFKISITSPIRKFLFFEIRVGQDMVRCGVLTIFYSTKNQSQASSHLSMRLPSSASTYVSYHTAPIPTFLPLKANSPQP